MADIDLVPLATVKEALSIEANDWDASLRLYISAASSIVLRHVKDRADDYLDENGDIADIDEVPPEWKQAAILLVGYQWRAPDGDPANDFADGHLPAPVVALLRYHRDPTVA